MQPGQIILTLETLVPSPKVLQRLELAPGSLVTRIERVRLGNDIPIGLQTSYLALPDGQSIAREELERSGSLYRILSERFHLYPTEADETLEVTVASPEEARLLGVGIGAPLLLSERVVFTERRPIEFVKILYRGDKYRYFTHLKR